MREETTSFEGRPSDGDISRAYNTYYVREFRTMFWPSAYTLETRIPSKRVPSPRHALVCKHNIVRSLMYCKYSML